MSYSAASPQVLEANASGGAGRIDAAAWSYSALAATGVTTLAWCGGFPNPVLGAGVAGAALASAAGARYGAGRGHWLLARLSAAACGAAGAYAGVQATCQNPEYNLYERTYVTDAKTANLEAFYGEDKLMEIFCIFPPVVKVLMQSGYWDDDGNYHTYGIPFGTMTASIDFAEKEEDIKRQAGGDGECVNAYEKKERFRDTVWGYTLWDQITYFGFRRLPDGRYECYQKGVYFEGFWPMRAVFMLHSLYVRWACERYFAKKWVPFQRPFEDQAEEDPEVTIKELLVSAPVFAEFLAGLAADVQASIAEMDLVQRDLSSANPVHAAAMEVVKQQRELLVKLRANAERIDAEYARHEGDAGRPPFDLVRAFLKRQTQGQRVDTEFTMLIGDEGDDEGDAFAAELKENVKVAMDRLKWSQKAAGKGEELWSLRQVTPTWIDGKELEPQSIAWSRLVHSTLDGGGLAPMRRQTEGPPEGWLAPLKRHKMLQGAGGGRE